jgi:hypothetical protein
MTNRTRIPRQAAVARIRRQWPEADEIRFEGKCPDCKRKDTLWSYQLPTDHPRKDGTETAGFWCSGCGWGNAGSRPSLDTDAEESHGGTQ